MNKIILLLIAMTFLIGLIIFRPFENFRSDAETILVADKVDQSNSYSNMTDGESSELTLEDESISNSDESTSSSKVLEDSENNPNDKLLSLNSLIDDISAEDGGLSDSAVKTALRLEDFEALVYQIERDKLGQLFEESLMESVNEAASAGLGIVPRSIGCNDQICAVVVDYFDPDSIEQFTQNLTKGIQQPVGIVAQPVTVRGVTELRLLLSYNSAKIVVP